MGDKQLYIFDLDGTIVNAFPAIVVSMNNTLEKLGYPTADPQKIVRAVGAGNASLLKTFFREDDFEAARQIYRDDHVSRLPAQVCLLPGALKLLENLRARSRKLAVATNRPRETADILLEATGIADWFQLVLCGEEVPRPKPAPDILFEILGRLAVPSGQAVYFGDMNIDTLTGKEAGVTTVIVTTGPLSREELEPGRPDFLIDSLDEVFGLKTLFPDGAP